MSTNKEVSLDYLGPLASSIDDSQLSTLPENNYLKLIKNNLKKVEHNAEQANIWTAIYQYSLIKMNKSCIEQCFAPQPLPEELKRKLNDQIETLRDSLIEMLHQQ